jgi:DUF4097 and DUF4098 domain-containing protein YvlB
MSRICKGCGAELIEAQRFCRGCGRPTDELAGENAPTQMMSPQPETVPYGGSAKTAPASRPDTSPVTPAPSYYQPPQPIQQAYAPPPAFVPPTRRSPVGWILAFLGIAVFAGIIFAVMFVARLGQRLNQPSRQQQIAQAGEIAFTETNSDRVDPSGSQTTFTKSFALGDGADIVVRNLTGSITVSSWDKPQAEVRVTKRDSDQVFFKNENGELSIRSAPSRGSSDVAFEIRVPREVGRLDLKIMNGGIKLSGVEGELVAETLNSSIELTNVAGPVRAKTTNGSINVLMSKWRDDEVKLASVNGNINLQIKDNVNAQFDAKVVHGSIQIDDAFGVPIDRRMGGGQSASGKIGDGGNSISLSTVNGSIRLTK